MNTINTLSIKGVEYALRDTSKAEKEHTHTKDEITDLSLSWDKIEDKPTKLSDFTDDLEIPIASKTTRGGLLQAVGCLWMRMVRFLLK